MHGHRFFVLNYYDRGVGQIRFPRGALEVASGEVVLSVPGELHDTSGIGQMGGWVVEFTGEIFGEQKVGPSLVLALTAGTPWLAFTGRRFGHAHVAVPSEDRPSWEDRLVRLERETRGTAVGSREAMLAVMYLLLIDFARLLGPARFGQTSAHSALVSEVFAVIERR
jgi:hypothetical protein